jgi:hypothetical protein
MCPFIRALVLGGFIGFSAGVPSLADAQAKDGQGAGAQALPPQGNITTTVHYKDLNYTNPHHQKVHPRWAGGTVVGSIPLGPVVINTKKTRWADEYTPVYWLHGDHGKPEKVKGQYAIYASKPGDRNYSPIWRQNYVIVPRAYHPQALRSKRQVLRSGYKIVPTDEFTN